MYSYDYASYNLLENWIVLKHWSIFLLPNIKSNPGIFTKWNIFLGNKNLPIYCSTLVSF